jgi:hypothetical protein
MGYRRSLKMPKGVKNRPMVMLAHRAAVRASPQRSLKSPLKLHPGFDQPTISEGYKENGVDLDIYLVLARRNEVEIAGATAQNGHRTLVRIRSGCFRLRSFGNQRGKHSKKNQQQAGNSSAKSGPVTTRRFPQVLQNNTFFLLLPTGRASASGRGLNRW